MAGRARARGGESCLAGEGEEFSAQYPEARPRGQKSRRWSAGRRDAPSQGACRASSAEMLKRLSGAPLPRILRGRLPGPLLRGRLPGPLLRAREIFRKFSAPARGAPHMPGDFMRASNKQTVPPQQSDEDVEQLRMELARRVAHLAYDKYWRTCRRPACQRHRQCAVPDLRCTNAPPPPVLTPDQEAASRAQLFRALQRRLAELQGEAG